MDTEEMKANPGENLFLVVVLTTLAGLFYFLAPPGLASNEEGVHYVQMKNFAVSGSFEITSPAQTLGFEPADVAGMRGFLEARGYACGSPGYQRLLSGAGDVPADSR